jgi:hypothetical protein
VTISDPLQDEKYRGFEIARPGNDAHRQRGEWGNA